MGPGRVNYSQNERSKSKFLKKLAEELDGVRGDYVQFENKVIDGWEEYNDLFANDNCLDLQPCNIIDFIDLLKNVEPIHSGLTEQLALQLGINMNNGQQGEEEEDPDQNELDEHNVD